MTHNRLGTSRDDLSSCIQFAEVVLEIQQARTFGRDWNALKIEAASRVLCKASMIGALKLGAPMASMDLA